MPNLGLLTPAQPASPAQSPDLFPFQRFVRHLMPLERVRELYRRAQQPVNRSILENVLTELRVECKVTDFDLARIPASGPAVVTANHPFGLLDGAVLGALLSRVRPDVKILTNFMLAGIPELHEHCIFVDPFGETESVARNRRGVKQALAWLSGGGVLVMFPAGEVSHLRFSDPGLGISDPEWNSMAARLVRMTGAVALPVFVPGCNSATFQVLGLLHSQLRTAWLPSEFLHQTDRTVEVRVGSRIPAEILRSVGSDREAAKYLRWRTYILAQRGHAERSIPPVLASVFTRKKSQPVADAMPEEVLIHNIERLGTDACLFENREFCVYHARAREIPDLLQEVGRLREITFRAVGEGTGNRTDLDRFDHYYTHLLLWSKCNHELVGAYRMGLTTEILPQMGVPGFYTSTLFRFDPRLFRKLGPALELGRSFIRPEYQKQYAPLLTLWRGIGRYLALRPQFAVLFGAVSVSNGYSRWSRDLIFRFFQNGKDHDGLRKLVSARRPFRPRWGSDSHAVRGQLNHLEHLTDPIADVESDGKSIPILLKHYAKLGGRMLSFNVDRNFSGVLDGLILVDLRRSERALLRRYLGEDGVEAFVSYHGLRPSKDPA
jgi:putative hemolysin